MQEKLGIDQSELLNNLRNEEAQLMVEMSRAMMNPSEKLGSSAAGIESRLQQVRAKITELDLKKS